MLLNEKVSHKISNDTTYTGHLFYEAKINIPLTLDILLTSVTAAITIDKTTDEVRNSIRNPRYSQQRTDSFLLKGRYSNTKLGF